MKCPVCDEKMDSMVCVCGYDMSRDFKKYPTFGMLSASAASVAVLRDRSNNVVRCAGCGYHGFSLNKTEGKLSCMRCGRALMAEELKPLTDALGMQRAEQNPEEKPAALQSTVQAAAKKPRNLMNMLWQGRQQNSAKPKEDPRRIVAVSAGCEHTAVLYADGTAAAVGENSLGKCKLSGWSDIVAIAAGVEVTTGLKKDGTVVQAGLKYGRWEASQWQDIVAISEGAWHLVGLKKDGTVVAISNENDERCDVSAWRNIQAVSAGDTFTMGLEKSGKVVFTGAGKGTKLPAGGLNNMKLIAAGNDHSVSVSQEGSVHIVGPGGNADALGADIVQVDAGKGFTVVRKADGTAAVTGTNYGRLSNVNAWRNLEMISAGSFHVVGLKKDGTLVAAGDNNKGQCDVHKLIRK